MLSSSLRSIAKRALPQTARRGLETLRAVIGPAPIDDAVLAAYRFAPEPSEGVRINLVAPGLDPASAFGGVNTCMEFLLKLLAVMRRDGPVELRLITERADALDETIAPKIAKAIGASLDGVTVLAAPGGAEIPTRARDLFIAYNWWTSLNIQPVLERQAEHFNQPPRPKIHFLQDYEPGFYPFSSGHLMARQAFNLDWPLWVIFNTPELQSYYVRMGDRVDRAHVFEPVLAPALRPYVEGAADAPRKRRLFVYARPGVPRNCWPLARRALQIWAAHDASKGWEAVSAGADHRPVDLGAGHKLVSLGKLSLDGYADLLRETAAALSLMSSPHPSYPPLEMAHFGVRVVTNGYTDKNLSRRHENITSLTDMRAESIAAALATTCQAFESGDGRGASGASHMPDFLTGDFDCLDAVAADLWNAAQ